MIEKLRTSEESQPVHPGLEALEDGYLSLDSSWRVTYWNAAAERMLMVSRGAVLGQVFWERLPQLRGSVAWDGMHSVRHAGSALRFLLPDPTGRARAFLSVYAAPLEDGGLAVHFRDATAEVRRAEQYSMLLESIHDGLIAADEHGQISYLNTAAEALLRLPRDRALGISLWSVLPHEPSDLRECLRATVEDGIQRHLRDLRPEGRVFRGRVFDLWTYPLSSGGISILFKDVSERVQREKELARLAAEAQEANRAKGRFFAAISHELRTPLNAIVGYTHLLSSDTYGAVPDQARRAADRARVCAEHLARLMDDVLLLTTSEIGRLPVLAEEVDLPDFLPTVVEPHRNLAEAKGLRFVVEIAAGIPVLRTDSQRLRQLIEALLSNAVKFTAKGEVRLSIVPSAAASGGEFPAEPLVDICVSDTGPGVPAEDQERIFAPFEQIGDPARSDSMLRGTGLGLTVARQLSELLSGTLFLAHTSAAGSRFCVRLPVALPARPH